MVGVVEQYRVLHRGPLFCRGTAIKGYVEEIKKVIEETNAKTLLDYGCDKGHQYIKAKIHDYWGVPMPYLYDPGVDGLERKPDYKFDGVICTDVLEHVENPEETIADILGYATKFAFLTISVKPSPPHKRLPDGRPLHISVHPEQWWRERISAPYKVVVKFDTDPPSPPFFKLGK